MKSWICSKCGGGRYFGILHKCEEEEVKDVYRSRCQFCGKLVITEDAVYLGHACLDCKDRTHKFYSDVPGYNTHTVELTEREWARIRSGLSFLKHAEGVDGKCYDHPDFAMDSSILAKLRPKKESVEFEVAMDNDYGAKITSDLMCVWAKSIDGSIGIDYPRKIFDALIAAYHAHVDEVK